MKNFRVNMSDIRKQIDENTIALVGSAPDYGYGLFDDFKSLGDIA
jgi:glutamate/tyrosine decarboxylase-like PLP-dependent enzyme